MRGVLEATPLALTETCSGSADRPLPRGPLSGGGLGPRSLALPLSQHSRPTDLGLAIVSTMSTPCRSCAYQHFCENSGASNLSRHTGEEQVHPCAGVAAASSPLYMFHPSRVCKVQPTPATKKTKTKTKTKTNKQNRQTNEQNSKNGSFSKPLTCHWRETQPGAQAPLPGRPALPLPTTVLDSRPTMYW